MRKYILPCIIVCSLFVCGCALRENADSSKPETPVEIFASRLTSMPEGSSQYFETSPFGPAYITAGQSYISGLGNSCRYFSVTSGSSGQKYALCHEKNGSWRILPSIFENVLR